MKSVPHLPVPVTMCLSMHYDSRMEYDAEILVPLCRKFMGRVDDFKRYGIFNTKGRRVLLSVILSANEEIEGIQEGWGDGVEARTLKNRNPDHVSNIYRFYAELKEESLRARWVIRVDDDSCTDVDGLLNNLDLFYDWEGKHYLGDLTNFGQTLNYGEGNVYPDYQHLLGDLEERARFLSNEIECGVISRGGLLHMLGNEDSMHLLKQRAALRGGFGDCVTAVAAAIAKLHPTQCPFISHLPRLNEFSPFGGHLNHIHMLSREAEGENFGDFERGGEAQWTALTRKIDGEMTELERSLAGKRFVLETKDELKLYEFRGDRTARAKFDDTNYIWVEHEGKICLFDGPRDVLMRLEMQKGGVLSGSNDHGDKFVLTPCGGIKLN